MNIKNQNNTDQSAHYSLLSRHWLRVRQRQWKSGKQLKKHLPKKGCQQRQVDFTGCHGFCQQGPIAVVEPEGIFYTHVSVSDVSDIVKIIFVTENR